MAKPPPDPADLRQASALASRWALRTLLHTLYVERCMAKPDPVAEVASFTRIQGDALDGVRAPKVGTVDTDMVRHLVLDEIETFLQGVAEEVRERVQRRSG